MKKLVKRNFSFPKHSLVNPDSKAKYCTTTSTNKEGKMYFYIYDYGFMDFSEKELMVVKLNKAK